MFLVKNNFGCIFIKLKCMCLQTGPGDLKNTKHLKFDIQQIFYTSLNILKTNTFFKISETRQ